MTATITIPKSLLDRLRRCQEFQCWASGQELVNADSLNKHLIKQLEEYCKCIEADMVTDDEGRFLADRLWIIDPTGGEK